MINKGQASKVIEGSTVEIVKSHRHDNIHEIEVKVSL